MFLPMRSDPMPIQKTQAPRYRTPLDIVKKNAMIPTSPLAIVPRYQQLNLKVITLQPTDHVLN